MLGNGEMSMFILLAGATSPGAMGGCRARLYFNSNNQRLKK